MSMWSSAVVFRDNNFVEQLQSNEICARGDECGFVVFERPVALACGGSQD